MRSRLFVLPLIAEPATPFREGACEYILVDAVCPADKLFSLSWCSSHVLAGRAIISQLSRFPIDRT
jgi:hypothetical protein